MTLKKSSASVSRHTITCPSQWLTSIRKRVKLLRLTEPKMLTLPKLVEKVILPGKPKIVFVLGGPASGKGT